MRVGGERAVMTTLEIVPKNNEPEPAAEEAATAAKDLVRMAREQELALTGPDGLLKHHQECARDRFERGDDRAPWA